jgi:hypothetical protein
VKEEQALIQQTYSEREDDAPALCCVAQASPPDVNRRIAPLTTPSGGNENLENDKALGKFYSSNQAVKF